jgi:antitoxin ParD1/3/4
MATESGSVVINITLPARLKKVLDHEVAAGKYGSASEFMREALKEKVEREKRLTAARQELDAKLLEGINSGPPIPYSDELFREKKEALIRRASLVKGRK